MASSSGDVSSFNERILEGLVPNFFELLSQEAMHDALRPAVQYLLKVFAQLRPDLLGAVWRCADEIYVTFECLLQLHFLRNYGGSFSEYFYSLCRVPHSLSPERDPAPLSTRHTVLSLLCLAIIPYIKVKLDNLYSRLQEVDDATPLTWWRGCGPKHLAVVWFFRSYPYVQSLWEGSKFMCRLLYLFKRTKYYSPLYYLSGLCVRRSAEDLTLTLSAGEGLLHWLTANLLPLAVFSLKFLEWWYSSERSAAVRLMTSLPIPPPPGRIKPNSAGIQVPPDSSLCPLCSNRRDRPTSLSSSGYVFCYSCIHDYLGQHGECPVTCLPSSRQQLIRLFPQQ